MTTSAYRFGDELTFTSTFDATSEPVTYLEPITGIYPPHPYAGLHRVRSTARGVIFRAYSDELTHRHHTQEA
jgi:hypothetical protein